MATPAAQYQYGMNINAVKDDNSTASCTSSLENSISTFGSTYAATEELLRIIMGMRDEYYYDKYNKDVGSCGATE
jgi:hypothetical protein